jgi:divalent metal cation (Fe/Co/Zn/Cd) transporter
MQKNMADAFSSFLGNVVLIVIFTPVGFVIAVSLIVYAIVKITHAAQPQTHSRSTKASLLKRSLPRWTSLIAGIAILIAVGGFLIFILSGGLSAPNLTDFQG